MYRGKEEDFLRFNKFSIYMYGAIQKLQMQNKLLYLNDLNCVQNNIQSIVHPENVEYPS